MKARLSIYADLEVSDDMTTEDILELADFLRHDWEKISINNHKNQNITFLKVTIQRKE